MPFNSAIVGAAGARVFKLAPLDAEDLAALYVVDTQIALQFPILAPALSGDVIQLTVEGFTFVAALADNYCIDADGVDSGATFELALEAGCFIRGRGGAGGVGGDGDDFPPGEDGQPGVTGGTAIRLGCRTFIRGIGTIERGYGGGGGGAGSSNSNDGDGGSGGGGGAPLGLGGFGGNGDSGGDGDNGIQATVLLGGLGGTRFRDGGTGGSNGILATAGQDSSPEIGGALGTDGFSIETQGHILTYFPGIIPVGPVI